jgi:hypothetical protein
VARFPLLVALALGIVPLAAPAAAPTIAAMKDHRRVLILTAPSANDPRLVQQHRALAGWRRAARARDVSVVELVGDRVSGAADRARLLRRQWHLPPGSFQAVLIGKDGHEVLRSPRPIAARGLQRTIDAMPMRRAGRR